MEYICIIKVVGCGRVVFFWLGFCLVELEVVGGGESLVGLMGVWVGWEGGDLGWVGGVWLGLVWEGVGSLG